MLWRTTMKQFFIACAGAIATAQALAVISPQQNYCILCQIPNLGAGETITYADVCYSDELADCKSFRPSVIGTTNHVQTLSSGKLNCTVNYNTVSATCTKTISYRCESGYFGTPTKGISGCTSCADATGNSNATSKVGATAITDCYIPAGNSDEDTTGHFSYTDDCKYSN